MFANIANIMLFYFVLFTEDKQEIRSFECAYIHLHTHKRNIWDL